MYRLIINTKEEFDAEFCSHLTRCFGQLELIPYSNNYCAVEGLKIQNENDFFDKAMVFFKEQNTFVNKMLISNIEDESDNNVDLLNSIALDGFFSSANPPKNILEDIYKVDSQLWMMCPLEFDDIDVI